MKIHNVQIETQETGAGGTLTRVHFGTDKVDATVEVHASGETTFSQNDFGLGQLDEAEQERLIERARAMA